MFQKLSANVDKTSYQAAMDIMMALYPKCDNILAWEPSNTEAYKNCTNQIIRSSTKIQNNFRLIESYSMNQNGTISIQAELEQILEDVELKTNPSKGIEKVLAYIENESWIASHSQPCFEKQCLEAIREVLIRLKLIEWGIFGLGTASTGLFVLEHYLMLGPYFGDVGGSNWPYIPFHKKQTSLEEEFSQLLTSITFFMSNGTLENVSLLDLPAFGSVIGTLRKDLKKQFNWPIETNHAILTKNLGLNLTKTFAAYKTLVEDWGQHMEHLGRNTNTPHFTLEMKNNQYLNFTRFIIADIKTFLIAISGDK